MEYYTDSDYDSDTYYYKSYRCKCGLMYSRECKNKLCHKCCTDKTCLRHMSDTSNICSYCGIYYYSLTCKNKMCIKCCGDDPNCNSMHVVYYKGSQYNGTLIEHTDKELNQIKNILQEKTILPVDIIDYTLDNYLNYGTPCDCCNKKFNTYYFRNCVKCHINCSEYCILEKDINNKSYYLCKMCFPQIKSIYDIYKNKCTICEDFSNDKYNSCKKCNRNACDNCSLIEHCWDCLETITNISSNSELGDFNRCTYCKHIYYYENIHYCEECNDPFCDNCGEQHGNSNFNWIGYICNVCSIKCEDCNKSFCVDTITECNICNKTICYDYSCEDCEKIICKDCIKRCYCHSDFICINCKYNCKNCDKTICTRTYENFGFCEDCRIWCNSCDKIIRHNKYMCNYCKEEFCTSCTEECKSCENNVCLNCYTEKNELICGECKY